MACWLSLVVMHKLVLWGKGFSLQSLGSRVQRLSTSACGLSDFDMCCSAACGIVVPGPGMNLCLLHWKAAS